MSLLSLLNTQNLDLLVKFRPLLELANKTSVASLTADDLATIFGTFGVKMSPETIQPLLERIPQFVTDADESVSQFISNGGLLRLFEHALAGSPPDAVNQCPVCKTHFFLVN